jgi:hypothetical protein
LPDLPIDLNIQDVQQQGAEPQLQHHKEQNLVSSSSEPELKEINADRTDLQRDTQGNLLKKSRIKMPPSHNSSIFEVAV